MMLSVLGSQALLLFMSVMPFCRMVFFLRWWDDVGEWLEEEEGGRGGVAGRGGSGGSKMV